MSREDGRGALRGVVGGGVAAALWLLVNGLNTALTFDSTIPSSLADLALPAAIRSVTWVSDAPWNILTPVLSALVVGVLVATGVRLAPLTPAGSRSQDAAERSARPWAGGLPALWFAVIVAAGIVGFALALGQTVHDWPPGRLWNAFDGFPDAVRAAVLWGLVWGWLPAVVVSRAAAGAAGAVPPPSAGARARAGASSRAGARRAFTALACGAGVVAVVVSSALTGYSVPTDPSEPPPVVQPTGPAVPGVAEGSPPIDPQWCSADQLSLEAGASDGAAGHRALGLLATNRSGVDCELNGYPDIAFADADDFLLTMHLVHGGSFATDDQGPTPITLGPGQSATAQLGWDAQPRDPDHTVAYLHLAPYSGAERVALPASGDLIQDADVAVTAWVTTPAD